MFEGIIDKDTSPCISFEAKENHTEDKMLLSYNVYSISERELICIIAPETKV